jgi:hypothetical protein
MVRCPIELLQSEFAEASHARKERNAIPQVSSSPFMRGIGPRKRLSLKWRPISLFAYRCGDHVWSTPQAREAHRYHRSRMPSCAYRSKGERR